MTVSQRQRDEQTDRGLMVLAGMWFALNFVLLTLPESAPPTGQRNAFQPPYQVLRHFPLEKQPSGGGRLLQYRLMRPADESSPTPLVVFLHGSGQRGVDNRQQLKGLPSLMAGFEKRKCFPCYLLAPQCPPHSSWRQEADRLAALIEGVMDAYSVDPQRVYLTGNSMGGFGAWHLAAERPDLFAAVVPLCGGGDPHTANRLVELPLWAVHGSDDSVVSVQNSREMVQAIRDAGGKPRYTELKGVGHACWPLAYGETVGVIPWMFEQRPAETQTGRSVVASPPPTGRLTSQRSHE